MAYNKNKLGKTLDYWSWDTLNLDFLKKCETSFFTAFCERFFWKNVSRVTFYQLTKFHCLIAFSSWNIGQYVYRNCLLTRLRRRKGRYTYDVHKNYSILNYPIQLSNLHPLVHLGPKFFHHLDLGRPISNAQNAF